MSDNENFESSESEEEESEASEAKSSEAEFADDDEVSFFIVTLLSKLMPAGQI